jgi:hypothetical protein
MQREGSRGSHAAGLEKHYHAGSGCSAAMTAPTIRIAAVLCRGHRPSAVHWDLLAVSSDIDARRPRESTQHPTTPDTSDPTRTPIFAASSRSEPANASVAMNNDTDARQEGDAIQLPPRGVRRE